MVHRQDALGCWWSVSKRTVRPDRVVVFELFPDDGLSPALLEFEKTQKIRRVEIHLLERTDVGKKRTGLSEVTLLGRESRSRRRR